MYPSRIATVAEYAIAEYVIAEYICCAIAEYVIAENAIAETGSHALKGAAISVKLVRSANKDNLAV